MYCTIYISRPIRPLDPFELLGILEVSRRNNERVDVTGVLFCNAQRFLQVLEGPEESVEATFQRIRSDARHDDVRVLWSGMVEERQFPGWYMRSLDRSEAVAVDFDSLDREQLAEGEVRDLVTELGGRASTRWLGERLRSR